MLICLVTVYVGVWTWLAIDPVWRPQWWLDNILVFVFVGALALWYRRYPLSDLSYGCIAVFMMLHAVGANMGYSNVPLGAWVSQVCGFARPNVYDRIVHFLFGFLLVYPLHETLSRYSHLKARWLYLLPVDFILSYSAAYELIEASTAWTLPADAYDPFVGLQGDIWDGYRDMLCAVSGAAVTMTLLWFRRAMRA
jgi:putative membrane protein